MADAPDKIYVREDRFGLNFELISEVPPEDSDFITYVLDRERRSPDLSPEEADTVHSLLAIYCERLTELVKKSMTQEERQALIKVRFSAQQLERRFLEHTKILFPDRFK